MSVQNSDQQRFLLRLAALVTGAAGVLLVAFTGSGAQSTASIGSDGATVRLGTGFSIEQWTVRIRTALLNMTRSLEARLTLLFEGPTSKVPEETGLLKASFQIRHAPDFSYIDLVWPPGYAQYLWDYAPGYVSQAGLARHGRVTYPNWSVWAQQEAMPIVAQELERALNEAGMDAEVTLS